MAYKHLSTSPTQVTDDLWYYEESRGIEFFNTTGFVALITWRKMRSMLRRFEQGKSWQNTKQ